MPKAIHQIAFFGSYEGATTGAPRISIIECMRADHPHFVKHNERGLRDVRTGHRRVKLVGKSIGMHPQLAVRLAKGDKEQARDFQDIFFDDAVILLAEQWFGTFFRTTFGMQVVRGVLM